MNIVKRSTGPGRAFRIRARKCAVACVLGLVAFSLRASQGAPNIVFLFADDFRAESLVEDGRDEVKTPSLDRLMEQGVTFQRAYTMGALTAPVCMASRAMVMTGRGLFEQVREGRVLPAEWATLPEAFHRAGYETYIGGKWHNDRDSLYRAFERGGTITPNPKPSHWQFSGTDFNSREPVEHRGVHTSTLIVDEAVKFLDTRDEARPFLMYLAFNAPHAPWQAPWRQMAKYPPREIALPVSFRGEHPFDNGELGLNGWTTETKVIGVPRVPNEVRGILAAYYAMITHLDNEIGRLFERMENLSLMDDTIVVFAADNGLCMGQHGLVSKQNIYESAVRVPLVFAGPGIPKGKVTDAFAYLTDIYPTLCDLAGVGIPETVTARSQRAVLTGESEHIRDDILVVYKNFMRGYATNRWKLHHYQVGGTKTALLYDLLNDPWEDLNLAADSTHLPVVERMTAAMQKSISAVGDGVRLEAPDWSVEEIPALPAERDYWRAKAAEAGDN